MRQREDPRDQRLRRDHRRDRREDDEWAERPRRRHLVEGVRDRGRLLEQQRALPEVHEHQRGQHDRVPADRDRAAAEVPHVRVQRLATDDDEDHGPEHQEALEAVPGEERPGVGGVHGSEHGRLASDLRSPEQGDRREPDEHDRAEQPADGTRAAPLHDEQADEDRHGDRNDDDVQRRRGDRGALNGGEHRDGRRDHPVAEQESGAEETEQDQVLAAAVLGLVLQQERDERENPSLAVVARAHHERHVLHGDHQDQRPEREREHAEDVGLRDRDRVRGERLSDREQRVGADVAVDDAERAEGEDDVAGLVPAPASRLRDGSLVALARRSIRSGRHLAEARASAARPCAGSRRAIASSASAAATPIPNPPASPIVRPWPVARESATDAPARPEPSATPRVSMRSVEESSVASPPSDDASITESGIVGNAIPMPMPVMVQPTYGTASGASTSARMSETSPRASASAPIATSLEGLMRFATRDCHQLPAAHAIVMNVSRIPASAIVRPRTAVSISGTNASPARNASDSRNAAAAAAAVPGRATSVPAGTMRTSAGSAKATPTTMRGIVHG